MRYSTCSGYPEDIGKLSGWIAVVANLPDSCANK